MPVTVTKVGPGSLTIGEVGSPIDLSCQILAATVASEPSADDPREVLCGDTAAGAVTYADALTITVLQDLANASGLVVTSWQARGTVVPFTYTPNDAAGLTITGSIRLDPVSIGGEVGSDAESDVTFAGIGAFVVTPSAGT